MTNTTENLTELGTLWLQTAKNEFQIFTEDLSDTSLKLSQLLRVTRDNQVLLTLHLCWIYIDGLQLYRVSDCCGAILSSAENNVWFCGYCSSTISWSCSPAAAENIGYNSRAWSAADISVFLRGWTEDICNPLDQVILQSQLTDVVKVLVSSYKYRNY
jgi:hypothetical protein